MINLNEIKFDQLERLVSNKLRFPIKFDISIGMGRFEKERFEIKSQELKQLTGIMESVYTSVVVDNFGGEIGGSGTYYWLPLHFSYEHHRGSNSTELGTAYYHFERKEWTVEFIDETK
jgi:hypothetical protein